MLQIRKKRKKVRKNNKSSSLIKLTPKKTIDINYKIPEIYFHQMQLVPPAETSRRQKTPTTDT